MRVSNSDMISKMMLMYMVVVLLISSVHAKSNAQSGMKSVQDTATIVEEVRHHMSFQCAGYNDRCCSNQNVLYICPFRHSYVAHACANGNEIGHTNDYYVLDGRQGATVSHHCLIWDTLMPVPQDNYMVTAQFYNLHGRLSASQMQGFPGLVINRQDERNYDYFYIRVHSSMQCYVRGYMTNGVHRHPLIKDCINQPQQKTWFTLSAKISGTTIKVFIDGVLVDTFVSQHPRTGKAAVMLWNGYDNVAFFKDFNILPL